jgi:hypothetical protein
MCDEVYGMAKSITSIIVRRMKNELKKMRKLKRHSNQRKTKK